MKPMQTKNVLVDTPQNACIFKWMTTNGKRTYNLIVTWN